MEGPADKAAAAQRTRTDNTITIRMAVDLTPSDMSAIAAIMATHDPPERETVRQFCLGAVRQRIANSTFPQRGSQQ